MDFLFDKDIFLITAYPIACNSLDYANPNDSGSTHDFTDGTDFALDLIKYFPNKKALLDLGTATGIVPLTMRETGLLAVGLEGSDEPLKRELGAWKVMPDIVRTCDISKPFRIVDREGNRIIFDFIVSWGTLEHIDFRNFTQTLENVYNATDKNSIICLNIDLGYNPSDGFHLLWKDWQGEDEVIEKLKILKFMLTTFFIIDEELQKLTDWHYCRPTKEEIKANLKLSVNKFSGRSFWWLRKK